MPPAIVVMSASGSAARVAATARSASVANAAAGSSPSATPASRPRCATADRSIPSPVIDGIRA